MFHLRKFFYDNSGNFSGEKRRLNELKQFFWIQIDVKKVSNPRNLQKLFKTNANAPISLYNFTDVNNYGITDDIISNHRDHLMYVNVYTTEINEYPVVLQEKMKLQLF